MILQKIDATWFLKVFKVAKSEYNAIILLFRNTDATQKTVTIFTSSLHKCYVIIAKQQMDPFWRS